MLGHKGRWERRESRQREREREEDMALPGKDEEKRGRIQRERKTADEEGKINTDRRIL